MYCKHYYDSNEYKQTQLLVSISQFLATFLQLLVQHILHQHLKKQLKIISLKYCLKCEHTSKVVISFQIQPVKSLLIYIASKQISFNRKTD